MTLEEIYNGVRSVPANEGWLRNIRNKKTSDLAVLEKNAPVATVSSVGTDREFSCSAPSADSSPTEASPASEVWVDGDRARITNEEPSPSLTRFKRAADGEWVRRHGVWIAFMPQTNPRAAPFCFSAHEINPEWRFHCAGCRRTWNHKFIRNGKCPACDAVIEIENMTTEHGGVQ